jgi:hypothetical protein
MSDPDASEPPRNPPVNYYSLKLSHGANPRAMAAKSCWADLAAHATVMEGI